jgi:hypothetical protein
MRANVPPRQRVHRILKGSRCYLAPELRFGRPFPKDVTLAPSETCIGGIWGRKLEAILTDRGAWFRVGSNWKFVRYGDIEDVIFPDKSDPDGWLTIRTATGKFNLLKRVPELWTAGRFFMRCAADAKRQPGHSNETTQRTD